MEPQRNDKRCTGLERDFRRFGMGQVRKTVRATKLGVVAPGPRQLYGKFWPDRFRGKIWAGKSNRSRRNPLEYIAGDSPSDQGLPENKTDPIAPEIGGSHLLDLRLVHLGERIDEVFCLRFVPAERLERHSPISLF